MCEADLKSQEAAWLADVSFHSIFFISSEVYGFGILSP